MEGENPENNPENNSESSDTTAEKVVEEVSVSHEDSGKKGGFVDGLRKNPWMVSTFVFAILALILIIGNFAGGLTGRTISKTEAGEMLLAYYESTGAEGLTLDSVEESNGLYVVNFDYNGAVVPIYMTKDGELAGSMNQLSDVPSGTGGTQTPPETEFTEEDKAKLLEFSECLADKGVKAYGAGWCGYCKRLKETFGGAEQIEPFYIECQNADRTPTEHADTCEEEAIRGYPTIKMNGESSELNALSTLEEFAEATGCTAPELSEGSEESEE